MKEDASSTIKHTVSGPKLTPKDTASNVSVALSTKVPGKEAQSTVRFTLKAATEAALIIKVALGSAITTEALLKNEKLFKQENIVLNKVKSFNVLGEQVVE
eukprot:Platyproteum_vivax@DN7689_c6_g1_i30.p2